MCKLFNIFKRKPKAKKLPLVINAEEVLTPKSANNTFMSSNTVMRPANPPPLRVPYREPIHRPPPPAATYHTRSTTYESYVAPSYVPQPVQTDDGFTTGLLAGVVGDELLHDFDKSDSSQNDDVFSGGGGTGGGGGATGSWSDDTSTKTDDTPDMNTFSDSSSSDVDLSSDVSSNVDTAFDSN